MLENPVYPSGTRSTLARMGSDNPAGAENQQERLIEFRGWVIGFVDGEGCFSIGFVRQPSRSGRCGYRTGYQVAHEFAVAQGASSVDCLHELRDYFGVGQVLRNTRYDNHREHLYRFVVRRAPGSGGAGHPVLQGASDAHVEAGELREVRRVRRADFSATPSERGRSH
jgi:hypothetical protein